MALVKINVDENPQAPAVFRVQGIPAVYTLRDGKVIDGFVGAQGEAQLREFIDRLLPSEAESSWPSCWRPVTRSRCGRCSSSTPERGGHRGARRPAGR